MLIIFKILTGLVQMFNGLLVLHLLSFTVWCKKKMCEILDQENRQHIIDLHENFFNDCFCHNCI